MFTPPKYPFINNLKSKHFNNSTSLKKLINFNLYQNKIKLTQKQLKYTSKNL